ncbi:MAG: NTP transferase domain-containing protein, partial [Planctomycetales bacterium]|nr:NTP transferase domain-containing protein [Planctomycetales bacterium]
GPAAALATALEECRARYAFVVGCDMPDLDRDFVLFLVARAGRSAAVVPDGPGGLEPLHAVYRRDAAAGLRVALAGGLSALRDAVATLRPDRVTARDYAHLPGAAASLRNLNTTEEIEARLHAGGAA